MGFFTGAQKNLVVTGYFGASLAGWPGNSKPAIGFGGVYIYVVLSSSLSNSLSSTVSQYFTAVCITIG
jgi:hypothetical protein